jgi:ATP-dependent Clp protease protease subunit
MHAIVCLGEKGKRHCLPNASIMIHREQLLPFLSPPRARLDLKWSRPPTEPSGGASGQASDIAIHAREILRIRKLLTGIYQRHCGRFEESQEQGLHRFGTSFGV